MFNMAILHCPRCMRTFRDVFPALSRRDNRTQICPMCGTEEALEDARLVTPYTGHQYWESKDVFKTNSTT